MEISKMKK